MGIFNIIQTYRSMDVPQISQVAQFTITPSGDGPVLWLHDAAGQSTSSIVLASGFVSETAFQHQYYSASQSLRSLVWNGQTRTLDLTLVDQVLDGAGPVTAYLDRVGFYGNALTLTGVHIDGSDFLFGSAATGSGLHGYRQGQDGSLSLSETVADTASTGLETIVAMVTGTVLDDDTLVTASASTNRISLFHIDANGQLTLKDDTGAAEHVPISTPSGVELLTVAGQTFVIATASGSSSLTVFTVGRNGAMEFSDQVIDTLDTRFGAASALATINRDGVGLIAVAGNDGGISLFQLLPGGRLVLRETVVDQANTALSGIVQLKFVQVGQTLQLVALASGDQGITRLRIDVPTIGTVATGQDGTAWADVLTASSSGGQLWAYDGDDILIDSFEFDQLWGGDGADLFVFSPDGNTDMIADFDISVDRIDLSAYALLHDVGDIEISETPDGIRLDLGDDEILVMAAFGTTLEAADFTNAVLFNATHVGLSVPMPVQGSAANDMFYWSVGGAGLIDGGPGFDTVDYALADAAIIVALDRSAPNSGAATGDDLSNVERIIATRFNDTVFGDHLGNVIEGGAGDDTIWGNSGADWIVPGTGNDRVQGGPGTDTVSYVDSPIAIIANLADGRVTDGSSIDELASIENLTGTVFGDYIVGNSADNRLRGLGDYDWMVGSGGADTFDGGNGRDMVSYVASPAAVTVDLGQGLGLAGQADRDRYISIERVTGSSFGDLFYGSAGADDFRGLGGYDWFVGSDGGKDRYYGGSGLDTVAYTEAASGVVASLLLGRGSLGQARSDLYFDIENLTGSSFADQLTGDNTSNILRGMWGEDILIGNGGNDRLTGGGSNDLLDGGAGWDYAYFAEAASAYDISTSGQYTYVDRIEAGGDGRDQLINVEVLVFADQSIYL